VNLQVRYLREHDAHFQPVVCDKEWHNVSEATVFLLAVDDAGTAGQWSAQTISEKIDPNAHHYLRLKRAAKISRGHPGNPFEDDGKLA
jgi:hypothetical protein